MSVKLLGVPGLFGLGAILAVAGAAVSLEDVRVLGVSLPTGLVFVVVVTGLFFRTARLLLGASGAIAAAVGWVAGIIGCLWPRAEGDVLIPGDWIGVGFLLCGAAAATWSVGRAVGAPEDLA